MAMNIPATPVDPRAAERTQGAAAPAPAPSSRVEDSVRVSPEASAAQQVGGGDRQLSGAARALGEALSRLDTEAEAVGRAEALVQELSRTTPSEASPVLARLDGLGRSAEGQAAQLDRERLGLTGTPGEAAVRAAGETLTNVRAGLEARRAQLEQEGEAIASQLVEGRQPPGLSADRVQRAREQISSDAAAAVAAQAAQLSPAASQLLA